MDNGKSENLQSKNDWRTVGAAPASCRYHPSCLFESDHITTFKVPQDVSLRIFGSENITSEPLQMIGDRYEINAWSFNDLFMELGNHRQGSYYSKFTGDTRPCMLDFFVLRLVVPIFGRCHV